MHVPNILSILLASATIVSGALASPLQIRDTTNTTITSVTTTGAGCPNPASYNLALNGGVATLQFFSFGVTDSGTTSCEVDLAFEFVIPADGMADLVIQTTAHGTVTGNPGFVATLATAVTASGRTVRSSNEAPDRTPMTVSSQLAVTYAGAVGSTGSGTATANIQLSGSGDGDAFVDDINFRFA